MRNLVIICKSQSEKITAASLCGTLGYRYEGRGDIHKLILNESKELTNTGYPNIEVDFVNKSFDFTCKNLSSHYFAGYDYLSWSDELSTILDNLKQTKKVKISKDYDAVVTKTGIQVGCQTISFEDFDKLAELVKTVR